GPALPRALRLGAGGRHLRPAAPRRAPETRRRRAGMVLPRRAGRMARRLQQRLRPGFRAGQARVPLRQRGFAARRSRVERRQSLLRPVALRLQLVARHTTLARPRIDFPWTIEPRPPCPPRISTAWTSSRSPNG